MKAVLILFFSIHNLICFSQQYIEPEYNLLDSFENSDLNYSSIDSINSITGGITMLDSVFNVVKGKYTVYRFMTYDRGILFDGYESDFNNLIILKVDSTGIIVDGYKYFLQNPEMPSTCFLYKLTKKKRKKEKLKIKKLKFKRINTALNENEICSDLPLYLIDERILKFKN